MGSSELCMLQDPCVDVSYDVILLRPHEKLMIAPRDLIQRHVSAGRVPEQPLHRLRDATLNSSASSELAEDDLSAA